MKPAQAVKTHEETYTIEDSMDTILLKLGEVIDNVENGNVMPSKKHGKRLMLYKRGDL